MATSEVHVYEYMSMHWFVCVCVCLCVCTWHADAGVFSNLVQAGGIILAGIGQALVDVLLAARPHVSLEAVTGERALCVHTQAVVLARVRTWGGGGHNTDQVIWLNYTNNHHGGLFHPNQQRHNEDSDDV